MKVIKITGVALTALLVVSALIVGTHFAEFWEAYNNGFYEMQTPLGTVSAWLGNMVYDVAPWWKL